MAGQSRRDFLKLALAGLGGAFLSACGVKESNTPAKPVSEVTELPVATLSPASTQSPAPTQPATRISATATAKPTKSNSATATTKPKGKTQTPAPAIPIPALGDSILLGRPTADSITLSLLASTDRQIVLAYGTRSGETNQQTAPVLLKAKVPQPVEIPRLLPNTQYFYRVLTNGVPADEHAFHTQRAPGSYYTFTIDADPHNREPGFNGELYARTLNNVLADHPDFHINLGDTFMTEKLKPQTLAEAESTFTDMRPYFGISGTDVPLFLVNGNHEGELGWLLRGTEKDLPVWSTQLRQRYFPNPTPNGFYTGSSSVDPVLGKARDGYYAWTWGDALFIVLDPFWYTVQKPQQGDVAGNWNWTLGREQYNWLKSTLETSAAPFKFVFTHHLVGGSQEARGGIEFARFYEWGGANADGSSGFAARRPGWGKPIHSLLVEHGVNAVFHGHDHLYAQQDLDGIVYQEVPQPSIVENNPRIAAEYGYVKGEIHGSSGHLRVSVGPDQAVVEYIRTFLPQDEKAGQQNRQVEVAYDLFPR